MTDSFPLATGKHKVIEVGTFFCKACLIDKPLDDQSTDPRYCQFCFEFLLEEVEFTPMKGKRTWQPVGKRVKTLPAVEEVVTKPITKGNLLVQKPEEVLLHKNKGGRPRKPKGEQVSRMTEWRRQKETQGVLM